MSKIGVKPSEILAQLAGTGQVAADASVQDGAAYLQVPAESCCSRLGDHVEPSPVSVMA